MTQTSISSPDLAPLQPVVTVLQCSTELVLDPTPLEELFETQGEIAAEDTVCRVLEDLSRRMGELHGPRQRCAFNEIDVPAERIAVIADQIGLTEVSIAARHVATTARQQDGVALEATLSRLERSYDSALSAVWNFQIML